MTTEWEFSEDGQAIRVRWVPSDAERADWILQEIPAGPDRSLAVQEVLRLHMREGVPLVAAAQQVKWMDSMGRSIEGMMESQRRINETFRQLGVHFDALDDLLEAYASYPRFGISGEYPVAAPPEVTLDAPAQAASIPAFLRDLACHRGAPPGTRTRNPLFAHQIPLTLTARDDMDPRGDADLSAYTVWSRPVNTVRHQCERTIP